MNKFSGRTLLMPTFTSGFNAKGFCDLDVFPSQTGALSETFRSHYGVKRTRSAFFSFAVHGPKASELTSLNPQEAWGAGSLYEWLYNYDVAIVTMGLHPTHCSHTHYAEWINRQHIPYRFNKTFSGMITHEGATIAHTETLFVRQKDPEPINDFTWLLPTYLAAGMQVSNSHGYQISCMRTKTKIDTILALLNKDSLALISNKEFF
jgi:aminoglycoside N3'-acetyltransferase